MPDADVMDAEPIAAEAETPEAEWRCSVVLQPSGRECAQGLNPQKPGHCFGGHFAKGNQASRVHGLYSVRDRGLAAVAADVQRSAAEEVDDIMREMGGSSELTAQQRALLSIYLTQRVSHDHAYGVGKTEGFYQGRRLHPCWIVIDRAATQMRRILLDLGLERRARQLPSLSDYLTSRAEPVETDEP